MNTPLDQLIKDASKLDTEEHIREKITKTISFSELSKKERYVLEIVSNSTNPDLDVASGLDISTEEAIKLQANLKKKMGAETYEEMTKFTEEKGLSKQPVWKRLGITGFAGIIFLITAVLYVYIGMQIPEVELEILKAEGSDRDFWEATLIAFYSVQNDVRTVGGIALSVFFIGGVIRLLKRLFK